MIVAEISNNAWAVSGDTYTGFFTRLAFGLTKDSTAGSMSDAASEIIFSTASPPDFSLYSPSKYAS